MERPRRGVRRGDSLAHFNSGPATPAPIKMHWNPNSESGLLRTGSIGRDSSSGSSLSKPDTILPKQATTPRGGSAACSSTEPNRRWPRASRTSALHLTSVRSRSAISAPECSQATCARLLQCSRVVVESPQFGGFSSTGADSPKIRIAGLGAIRLSRENRRVRGALRRARFEVL